MEKRETVYVRIRGRVQGVGYRYFALEKAQELDLAGWVRNCPNGDVEAEAHGTKGALETWLAALREGPMMARVTAVHPEWRPLLNPPDRFEIR